MSYATLAAFVGLAVTGAIAGACLVLLVAERQEKRRKRDADAKKVR